MIDSRKISSIILWGPPGIGKTSLAFLIANHLNKPFYQLSVISSGVKDIRDVIQKAKSESDPILFIDEIHRFSKSQQDSLLGAVEQGVITFIGLANPNALLMANAAFDSIHIIGWPESRIILGECTVYLATSPKSNSTYSAIDAALAEVKNSGDLPVPLHL